MQKMVKDIKANKDEICFHDYYLIKISHYNSEICNFTILISDATVII